MNPWHAIRYYLSKDQFDLLRGRYSNWITLVQDVEEHGTSRLIELFKDNPLTLKGYENLQKQIISIDRRKDHHEEGNVPPKSYPPKVTQKPSAINPDLLPTVTPPDATQLPPEPRMVFAPVHDCKHIVTQTKTKKYRIIECEDCGVLLIYRVAGNTYKSPVQLLVGSLMPNKDISDKADVIDDKEGRD